MRQFFAGELGLAFGFIDQVPLAPEAAVGEPGKGIEHAEIVEGVGDESLAEDVTTKIGDRLADLGGCELLSGLESTDVIGVAEKIKGAILAGAALVDQPLLAKIVLVTASFPPANAVFGKIFAVLPELANDFLVGKAVIEHFIDALADFLGQAGDFAVAVPGGGAVLSFGF